MQKTLILFINQKQALHKNTLSGYQMSFKHEMMIKGLILMLKNKQPEFCEIISKSFDASDFSYLDGLVEYVRGI